MRVLFVGGTGNISGAVSRLAVERGIDLVHLNRGRHGGVAGVRRIEADYGDP
ncbi:MAG TPA: NAD-dependent dehydratase, partial [Vicinamibacteria bacterium]